MADYLPPLTLLDLDDTIFQTAKHVPADQLRHVATLDQAGQPLSWMSDPQQQFWKWLSQTTEIIPVTARSVTGLARVQLPFGSWAVCQHGAVILTPDRQFEPRWWAEMTHCLQPYRPMLVAMLEWVQAYGPEGVRAWIAEEQGTLIYLVVKQPDGTYFSDLMAWVQQQWPDQFYGHVNGRTMALLPQPIRKRRAVEFLFHELAINPESRVVVGWGDSLSDLEFLQCCDWWGVPRVSQAGSWVREQLVHHLQVAGRYDHEGR